MPTSKEELLAILRDMSPEERAELLSMEMPVPPHRFSTDLTGEAEDRKQFEDRQKIGPTQPETYGDLLAEAGYGQVEREDRQKTGPTRTQREATAPDHTEDRYAATKWGGSEYRDLKCPSGQTCLVRRPGIQGLLNAGVLHDMDPLVSMVGDHANRVLGREDEIKLTKAILADDSRMQSLLHMVDRVVCHTVIKPRVVMTPNDVTRRQEGVIYCDMIDLEDRMFIMQYSVGGSADVANFRSELSETLGSMDDESSAGSETE